MRPAGANHLITGLISSPMQYVTTASPKPTTVISVPLFHHVRPVTITFDAPTAKCAAVLMANDQASAGIPDKNINGNTGTIAPTAVLTVALTADRHGFGNDFSDNPNSSCANVFNNCSGCSASFAASCFASVAEKPSQTHYDIIDSAICRKFFVAPKVVQNFVAAHNPR